MRTCQQIWEQNKAAFFCFRDVASERDRKWLAYATEAYVCYPEQPYDMVWARHVALYDNIKQTRERNPGGLCESLKPAINYIVSGMFDIRSESRRRNPGGRRVEPL